MTDPANPPLILEPENLEEALAAGNCVLVDIGAPDTYVQRHIPGAVFLEYAWILEKKPPVMGLLPSPRRLANVLGATGITPESHVIAYDDEGGGRAARLLWTLDVIGHRSFSLLNGCLPAWVGDGRATADEITVPTPARYPEPAPVQTGAGYADRDYVLAALGKSDTVILDARSAFEYDGRKALAKRGGHIPGAVHLEWTEALDRSRNMRLKQPDELRTLFASAGATPEKEIITHCQTHHRSALTYAVLKSLGYERIQGYAGSWSEWGNADDTPVG